jgi:glycosyltransferase involved in cell wall biosynthesis
MDLSIIVPVYNVEKYIRACMESIFKQGLDNDRFEIIIVNDGTKDRSMEVIADIIEKHQNITVINQKNQGLSVARNNGIAVAKGEYIFMPDPDDMLIDNSLSVLLDLAINNQADLVVADFLEMHDEEINLFINRKDLTEEPITVKVKTGEELFLQDLNPYQCYVWRTLFRRVFLNEKKLSFEPGIFYQDVLFTHECYLKANKCLRVSKLLNIYRLQRNGAATASFSKKKAKDYCIVISKTWKLTYIQGISHAALNKIKDDMYITFSLLIYSILHSIKSPSDQLEIIRFLNRMVPDIWFTNGIKQRFESFLLKKCPSLYLNIRRFHWLWIHQF